MALLGGVTVLEVCSEPRGHHGIAPLDKCHYFLLVPAFWLQFSRILLSAGSVGSKKFFKFIL